MFLQNKNLQKTILNIVFIYLFTTILLVGSISYIYYNTQQQEIFKSTKKEIAIRAKQIINTLEELHTSFLKDQWILYPSFSDIKSAIYDIDFHPIHKEFKTTIKDFHKLYFIKDNNIYFIYKIEPYYLGAAYLVIQKNQTSVYKNLK